MKFGNCWLGSFEDVMIFVLTFFSGFSFIIFFGIWTNRQNFAFVGSLFCLAIVLLALKLFLILINHLFEPNIFCLFLWVKSLHVSNHCDKYVHLALEEGFWVLQWFWWFFHIQGRLKIYRIEVLLKECINKSAHVLAFLDRRLMLFRQRQGRNFGWSNVHV